MNPRTSFNVVNLSGHPMSEASKTRLSEMLIEDCHPFAQNLNVLHISPTFDSSPSGDIENQIHGVIGEVVEILGSASEIDGVICPGYGPAAFMLGRALFSWRPLSGPFDPKLIVVASNSKTPPQFTVTQLL